MCMAADSGWAVPRTVPIYSLHGAGLLPVPEQVPSVILNAIIIFIAHWMWTAFE